MKQKLKVCLEFSQVKCLPLAKEAGSEASLPARCLPPPQPAQRVFLLAFPSSWRLTRGTAVVTKDLKIRPQLSVGLQAFFLC